MSQNITTLLIFYSCLHNLYQYINSNHTITIKNSYLWLFFPNKDTTIHLKPFLYILYQKLALFKADNVISNFDSAFYHELYVVDQNSISTTCNHSHFMPQPLFITRTIMSKLKVIFNHPKNFGYQKHIIYNHHQVFIKFIIIV